MDDMVLWSDRLAELRIAEETSRAFLREYLGLALKTAYVNRTAHGLNFLGCRVFPTHIILNRHSRRRFRRRLAHLEWAHAVGRIGEAELQQRADSLVAFTRMAGVSSWRFRQATLQKLMVGGQEPRSV